MLKFSAHSALGIVLGASGIVESIKRWDAYHLNGGILMNISRIIIAVLSCLLFHPVAYGMEQGKGINFIANLVHINFVDDNNQVIRSILVSPEQLQLLQRESTYFNGLPPELFEQQGVITLPIDNADPDAFDLVLRLLPQSKEAIVRHLNKVAPEVIFNLVLMVNFLDIGKLKTVVLSKPKIQELATHLMGFPDKLAQLTMSAKYTMCSPHNFISDIYPLTITNSLILRHDDECSSAVWSLDSKHVLTASNDGIARIWNASTGKLEHAFSGRTRRGGNNLIPLSSAAWSPDGSHVITSSEDNSYIWRISNGSLVRTLPGSEALWNPNGSSILTVQDDVVHIYNASNGQLKYRLRGQEASWSPDGSSLLVLYGEVHIYDASNGKLKYTLPGGEYVTELASWSIDGHILTGRLDEEMQVIYFSDGQPIDRNPNYKYIWLSSENNTARILNIPVGQQLEQEINQGERAQSLSPDGQHIIVLSGNTARIFNIATGQLELVLSGPRGSLIVSALWSLDGKKVVGVFNDKTARIWSIPTMPVDITLDELLISTALINGAKIDNALFNMISGNTIDLLLAASNNPASRIQPAMRQVLESARKKRSADEMTEEAAALQPSAKKKKTRKSEEASSSSPQ